MTEDNNIILFPNTFETLESESFALIDEQNFIGALEKLNILLAHQVSTYEIHVGKLICLIKLERLEEAEHFCEQLLTEEDEHYYDYIEYFIMILYEQEKYSSVMEVIDEEKSIGQIPLSVKEKFAQLYEICFQINDATANGLMNDLKRAIKERNDKLQLHILNKWKQLRIKPPETFSAILKNQDVHPVVKTKILHFLRTYEVNEYVEVEKFDEKILVRPKTLLKMDEQPIYRKVLANIQMVEQHNPTLYQQVKELFDQSSYVCYPFSYPENNVEYVAKALINLSELNLAIRPTDLTCHITNNYMNKIQKYHEIYLEIMLQ